MKKNILLDGKPRGNRKKCDFQSADLCQMEVTDVKEDFLHHISE